MTSYSVSIESGCETQVTVSVVGGPAAYNTARAMAVAIARVNPGACVAVSRDGRVTERYEGKTQPSVVVRRVSKPRIG